MDRQHWCSFCHTPFKNDLKLEAHLNFHAKQPPVACNLCPLTFVHHSQLGNHIRYMHSDDIISKFVEFAKRSFTKNIQDIKTDTKSDFDWLDRSQEQNRITIWEEGECSEQNYRRVKGDYECMDESDEIFTKEIYELIEQNEYEASDNKDLVCEPNLNGISKDCIEDGNRKHVNSARGQVSFLLLGTLESKTIGKSPLNANLVDNVPLTTNKYTELQKKKSKQVKLKAKGYAQRPFCNLKEENDPSLSETCQNSKTSQQIQEIVQLTAQDETYSQGHIDNVPLTTNRYTELQKKKSAHVKLKAKGYAQRPFCNLNEDNDPSLSETCQNSKTSQQIQEIVQLTAQDETYSQGQIEWKEAIDKLKLSFMKRKKRDRKGGRFISNSVSFPRWFTVNFPAEGIMCGCGRNLKTAKAAMCHIRRKSRTARKSVKLFKKAIVYNQRE
ncbi:uncharacterized protein LOC127719374 isoform X1 [Mytilus californianus]|uniref:uncharacterized protein LOC127719374 isoform X1 n=1 Tax=Mytilus californianus TaxID=6549 RepID=UPI00224743EF|nr:uncharacterized protein LOC127719374 isoform X1 [Mytilus californianus]